MGGMDRVCVAVAVVTDDQGRILVSQRHPDAHQGGLWEFPGGKCEPEESAQEALARELGKELGIEPRESEAVLTINHDYPDKHVQLVVFRVLTFTGQPLGREGQPVRWITLDELGTLDFPKANSPILEYLQSAL